MLTCEAAMAFAWLNISMMPSTNASEVSFTSVMIDPAAALAAVQAAAEEARLAALAVSKEA